MRQMRAFVGMVWAFALPLWGSVDHNPLLPRPQQVRYGIRHLPVRGLAIRFASKPNAEDRFAARELSSFLSKAAGQVIQVSDSQTRGPAITLRRTGTSDPLPEPGETTGPESRESYSLRVTADGAELEARSSAGLYYGVQTARQLIEGYGPDAVLPEVEIHDWPSLAYRGIMVDTSHGPLPTESEVKRQIDFLSRWKANQYFLYSEASIEMEGYPLLNPGAQFTQDQVRRIVAHARKRHIDVIPCMELYGHLHDLFRIERYADLAIMRHGSEFDPRNPQVAALLDKWIGQLAVLFPSPFFHIGFDETWETGVDVLGGKVHPAQLYMDHFRQVYEMLRRRGKTVMAWSDMFSKYPDLIPSLPAGTILVPWGYDRKVYEPYWKPFADRPIPKFIASGVSIWCQIAPNFDRSFDNIDDSVATGRKHGTLGLINTIWTDDVAVLMRTAFPGIAYGASASWQAEPVTRRTFFSDYARIMYSAPVVAHVAPGIGALDRAENVMAKAIAAEPSEWEETSPSFWDDPLAPRHLAKIVEHKEDYRQARLLAEEAEENLIRAIRLGEDASTLSDLLLDARMLDYAGMKRIYAAEVAGFWQELGQHPKKDKLSFYLSGETTSHDHSRIADLMDLSGDLREAFRAAWLGSYTPYRLGAVLGKWDAEFQYWWRLKRKLDDYLATFREGDTLRPLESFSPGY